MNNELTIVTGLWNIGRDKLGEDFGRTWEHYLTNFEKFLKIDKPMYIYTSKDMLSFIESRRDMERTTIHIREPEDFDWWYAFANETEALRIDPSWRNQTGIEGWLANSPQARLKYYLPIVMSKMFMLNDAAVACPYGSEYLMWLDAGITNTVHEGYFTHDKVLDKITQYMDKFLFLSFPYEDSREIHGFTRRIANQQAKVKNIRYVCRGGLFGGKREHIAQQNGIYYGATKTAFDAGCMGTEESIFSIMAHQKPELYNRYQLQSHGMISNFTEAVKNDDVVFEQPNNDDDKSNIIREFENSKCAVERDTSIYFLTFNYPQQLEHALCHLVNSPELVSETNKFCLDNSTDSDAIRRNKEICQKYGIEWLSEGRNLGICGGRQWIADHFDKTDAKYYIFFEDDMLICSKDTLPCKCGFIRWTPNLLEKMVAILNAAKLDFLKMSFSEFFGDHSKQWSWHNVPQDKREIYWPEMPEVKEGLNGPATEFKNIRSYKGLSYATGEIFYSNWPTLFNKEGNQKVFLETRWTYPYEQTWMSYVYTKIKEGHIKSGVLLASMIEHDRFCHYDATERREN